MRGDLAQTSLEALLHWAGRDKKTGLLGLEEGSARYALSFVAGRLVECCRQGAAASEREHGRGSGEMVRLLRVPLGWRSGRFVFQSKALDPAAPAGIDPEWILAQVRSAGLPQVQAAQPLPAAAPATETHSVLALRVAETVTRRDYRLPVVSAAALRVGQLSRDPRASLAHAAEAISGDSALSAAVLRCANSAWNSRGRRIDSIPMAVARLGFRTLLGLAMSVCLHSKKLREPRLRAAQADLSRHSLSVALFSRHLAVQFRLDDEQAFLCGLMHDMGKAVLMGITDNLLRDLARKGRPAEAQVLGDLDSLLFQHHCEVGRVLCAKWELPEAVGQTVAYHHEPERAESNQALVAVVALANTLLNFLERGEPLPEARLLARTAAARILGIGPDRAEGLGEAAAQFLQQSRELAA